MWLLRPIAGGRRRWLLGNCAACRHSSYIASSKTTYLKMVAIVKRWIAWLWSGAVKALQYWMRKFNFFQKLITRVDSLAKSSLLFL